MGTYNEIVAYAKSKIDLAELGISHVRPRTAVTGALILEVPGAAADRRTKADTFTEHLKEVLAGREEVKVTLPTKRAELRVRGLDISVTAEKMVSAVASAGDCASSEVRVGKISFA